MSPSRKAFDKLIATSFIPCISGHIGGTIYDSADGTVSRQLSRAGLCHQCSRHQQFHHAICQLHGFIAG